MKTALRKCLLLLALAPGSLLASASDASACHRSHHRSGCYSQTYRYTTCYRYQPQYVCPTTYSYQPQYVCPSYYIYPVSYRCHTWRGY